MPYKTHGIFAVCLQTKRHNATQQHTHNQCITQTQSRPPGVNGIAQALMKPRKALIKFKEANECSRRMPTPLTEHAMELGANHADQGLQRNTLAGQQKLTGTMRSLLCYTLCC